jgi:hypothetical protein
MVKQKYSSDAKRKEAHHLQKLENQKQHGHANQYKYAKKMGWIHDRNRHKASGYAAQKAWRLRKRVAKIESKALEEANNNLPLPPAAPVLNPIPVPAAAVANAAPILPLVPLVTPVPLPPALPSARHPPY